MLGARGRARNIQKRAGGRSRRNIGTGARRFSGLERHTAAWADPIASSAVDDVGHHRGAFGGVIAIA